MRIFNTFFALVLFAQLSFGALSPSSEATLFDHMVEVNKEWLVQKHYTASQLSETVSFANDNQRIQMHLQLVEAALRNATPASLSALQAKNREQALTTLNAYWKNGVFPINHYHKYQLESKKHASCESAYLDIP